MEEANYGQPLFLGLVVGLLLAEETSLCWLNSSMLVQGIPSTSSYALVNGDGFDWIYKTQVACLVFSGATQGDMQQLLYMTGVSLACTALLVNLGSRAWYFLQWRPISFGGPLAPFFAFLFAFIAGLCLPHMGHPNVESGGKAAVESIVNNAFWVAALFLISNFGGVQRLLLGGAEVSFRCLGASHSIQTCCVKSPQFSHLRESAISNKKLYDQAVANVAVGSWIAGSLLLNLFIVATDTKRSPEKMHDLTLLKDHYSPVGFRVPNFPNFTIDQTQAKTGLPIVSVEHEMYGAVFLAILTMGLVLSLSFTDWTTTVGEYIAVRLGNVFH